MGRRKPAFPLFLALGTTARDSGSRGWWCRCRAALRCGPMTTQNCATVSPTDPLSSSEAEEAVVRQIGRPCGAPRIVAGADSRGGGPPGGPGRAGSGTMEWRRTGAPTCASIEGVQSAADRLLEPPRGGIRPHLCAESRARPRLRSARRPDHRRGHCSGCGDGYCLACRSGHVPRSGARPPALTSFRTLVLACLSIVVHLFGYSPQRHVIHRPRQGGSFLSYPPPTVCPW